MTTLVAIKKDNQILLASDGRSTGGNYIYKDNSDKINDIGEWAIALSGLHVYKNIVTKHISDIKKLYPTISEDNILDFILYLKELFLKYNIEKIKRSDDTLKDDYSGIIVTRTGNIYLILSEPDYIKADNFLSAGSGSSYAEGALTILYDKKIRIEAMAKKSIETASDFDSATNDNISYLMYIIDNEG